MAQTDPTMPDREIEPGAQPVNPGRRNLLKGAGLVGAAAIGGSGARNPTLTSQALSWRTADYLANNWRSVAE